MTRRTYTAISSKIDQIENDLATMTGEELSTIRSAILMLAEIIRDIAYEITE